MDWVSARREKGAVPVVGEERGNGGREKEENRRREEGEGIGNET